MGANVINVLWQVFSRFVLDSPSPYTEELARFLLIWVALLGAAYAVRLKIHLAVDVFTERFTGRKKLYSNLLIQACVFLFALFVMVIGGYELVKLTLQMDQTSAALQIRIGYVYSVLPLSGLLILLFSGHDLVTTISSLNNDEVVQSDGTVK